jgi:nanoRNase/pAp phosphatase (c-di-AMP/oligoRNAs hydrolase)
MAHSRSSRSERFLATVSGCDEILVLTHDNPDPDAIATGWAICCLVQARLGKPVRLIGGGAIVRAENRYMLKLLEPPLELVRELTCPAGAGVVLVDCGSTAQNHLLPRDAGRLVAVIDHHPAADGASRPLFQDIRPRSAASASIAASYLREQGVEPGRRLATALLYALQTETAGNEVYYSRLDRTILLWLSRYGDPAVLAEIENAPLSPAYFADLALALQGTFIYGDTALCLLPRASGAEIVGEVADLLIRCEGIRRVLCGAVVNEDIVLSARTHPDGEDAAALVRSTVEGLGYGGGHRHRAGGKIPGRGRGPVVLEMLQDELLSRWLIACGIDHQRGHHLIARREIVENL